MTMHARHCAMCETTRSRSRRGSVLVAALVCLLVVMTMLGLMLQGTLRARRQLHAERNLRQTELLLQSGLDRAAFRLTREADYRGETWALPANAIAGTSAGQVVIQATRAAPDQPWQLHVAAEYPLGNERSTRRSRTFLVQSQPPRLQE